MAQPSPAPLPPELLRCVFALLPTDPQTLLLDHLRTLRRELNPQGIAGEVLSQIARITDRSGQVPDISLLRAYYGRRTTAGHPDGPQAEVLLTAVEQLAPPLLDAAQFRDALDAHREAVLTSVTGNMLVEAANIIRTGVTSRQKLPDGSYGMVTVKGVAPALGFLHSRLRDLDVVLRTRQTEGSFQESMDDVEARYDRTARDPASQIGVLSGLAEIDDAHRGIRRGNLALVLGFVGHMKSTFCLNWFYKAAVFQGRNVAIASLEMPTEDLADLMVCLHTQHPQFTYDRTQHFVTLDRLRTGVLTQNERLLLANAAEDLRTNKRYGRMFYKQPETSMTVADIGAWCERLHQDVPLDLLVIDYLGLVDSKEARGNGGYENLNRSIREAKLLAIEFAGGRGLPVLSPFQANREGFKDAEKNNGRYTLRALHGAPEAERSADLVYYVYLSDTMREAKELQVGNLKTRNVALLANPFRVMADGATRMIEDLDLSQQVVI